MGFTIMGETMETQAGEEMSTSPVEEEVVEDEAVETPEEELETSEETAIDAQKVAAMEQELARVREKLRDQDRALEFMQQVANRQQPPAAPEEPELDASELVEWGTVQKALEQQKQEFMLEKQKERITASEQQLQSEVPEWPEIYQAVVREKYESDPAFRNYIISRPDPARAAYEWAQGQETFKKLYGKRTSQKTSGEDVAKAQRNAQKPKTLSELGGSTQKQVDWSKMSREEFLKIANQNSYD